MSVEAVCVCHGVSKRHNMRLSALSISAVDEMCIVHLDGVVYQEVVHGHQSHRSAAHGHHTAEVLFVEWVGQGASVQNSEVCPYCRYPKPHT